MKLSPEELDKFTRLGELIIEVWNEAERIKGRKAIQVKGKAAAANLVFLDLAKEVEEG